jgi:hypothetical protein
MKFLMAREIAQSEQDIELDSLSGVDQASTVSSTPSDIQVSSFGASNQTFLPIHFAKICFFA